MIHRVRHLTLLACGRRLLFLGGFLITGAHAHSPHDVVTSVALSPDYANDQTLFVCVLDEFKRSTDGGYSWKLLENGLNGSALIADVVTSATSHSEYDIFVATGGNGVYRSNDRGDSWHPVNSGLDVLNIRRLALSADFNNDQTLVALPQASGLFVSTDGGDSWSRTANDKFFATSVSIVKDEGKTRLLVGTEKGEVYYSDEELRSWSRSGAITGSGKITALSTVKNEEDNNLHATYVGTELNGLHKTIDYGKSFTQVQFHPTLIVNEAPAHVTSIATVDNEEGMFDLFVTMWNESVFFSANGGETWQKLGRGLKKNHQADERRRPHFFQIAVSPRFAGDGNAFVAGFSGLFKTDNNGATWIEMETRPAGNIEGMALSPSFPNDQLVSLATYDAGAYISTDAGKTWQTRNIGLRSTHLWDTAITMSESGQPAIFSITNTSFLKTAMSSPAWSRNEIAASKYWKFVSDNFDEGSLVTRLARRFIDRPDFSFPTQIAPSSVFLTDSSLFLGTRYTGVLKTSDGGHRWTNPGLADKGWIFSIKVSPSYRDDRIIAASVRKKGFYLSSDGGENWQLRNDGLSALSIAYGYLGSSVIEFSPDYAEDRRIFFGTADGLYLSVNDGENWIKLNISGDGQQDIVRAIGISPDFTNDGTILVSIKGRGLFKSNDRGKSFVEIAPTLIQDNELLKLIRFSPVYAKDRTIFAASAEEAYVSHDEGVSWRKLVRPVRYENTKDNIIYSGKWKIRGNNEYSALNVHTTNMVGARADFRFVGSQVTWLGPKSEEFGMANVYLDGELVEKVDQFSKESVYIAPIFTIDKLSEEPHILTIKTDAENNPNASDHYIAIDAMEIM